MQQGQCLSPPGRRLDRVFWLCSCPTFFGLPDRPRQSVYRIHPAAQIHQQSSVTRQRNEHSLLSSCLRLASCILWVPPSCLTASQPHSRTSRPRPTIPTGLSRLLAARSKKATKGSATRAGPFLVRTVGRGDRISV
ncbi:hypothetical protein NDU88_002912 [Pleurodeles waltl]|uniref:Uncharacterized protein n=1 Tax=Pleurodeles waltl TaxID=8319 RepID=A0AAV7W462_PLEWA|nr:hypothetical protein NDU88_002912 [Pleurodeles waltl]